MIVPGSVRHGHMGITQETERKDWQMQTESQFLDTYDPSAYDRPSVTVDVLVFTVVNGKLHILLVKRNSHPFMGKWAIPGVFLGMDESADEAAARGLMKKTGVKGAHMEQLYTFSSPDRDPRMRVISITYIATVPFGKLRFEAGDTVEAAGLFAVGGIAETSGAGDVSVMTLTGQDRETITADDLAFDHAEIIRTAVLRMRGKIGYTDIAFGFLEDSGSFTLTQLRNIYEAVLSRAEDAGNFRRTILREYLAKGKIIEKGKETAGVGRPAMAYAVNL